MAPSEQASKKFNPPTIPLRTVFSFARRGVSRTAGRPDAGLGRRRPRVGAWGVVSDPPTDVTSPRHRSVPVLRLPTPRTHTHTRQ
eukprot:5820215-Pleurochrysis_carterae.AAC.1